jgi:hypothetical protein
MARYQNGAGRPGWRNKVEDHKSIDIRWLKREGMLIRGKTGSIVWSYAGQDNAQIAYSVGFDDSVTFKYRYLGHDGTWQPTDRHVSIVHTDQYLGGQRPWFSCCECGKRAAVLYIDGARIACRVCLDLIYRSQAERYWDRAERMAKRVLGKLIDGGDEVFKPKRMRWVTFDRLYDKYIDLQEAASDGFLLKIDRLLKKAG